MDMFKHVPSTISPSFSDGIGIAAPNGTRIFISGQVGVPLPPEQGSVVIEDEVRITFERTRASLAKFGAGMEHVVNIKTYLTDLAHDPVFSRNRGAFFPKDPPTSSTVQFAGLVLGAKIEIDAVAFLPAAAP